MAINWDSIEKQAEEKRRGLQVFNSRTTSRPVPLPTVKNQTAPSLDGMGAALAKSTLTASPLENVAARSALLPMRSEPSPAQDTPTAAQRIGSGLKSIGQTLAATPFVLGEALKADLDATTKARQDRGEFSSTFDVDPDTFGKASEPSGFDIDPDTVEQNPNAGSEKYQKPLDPNSTGMRMMGKAMESRQAATRGMSGVPKFLADTGLSIGQNAVLLPTAVISPAIPLAAMGAQSAAQKTYELTAQGKNAGEALGRGIVSGGIEAATEKLPLDTLADLVKTGGKGVVRNLLKQAGVEATEEGLSYAANFIADKAAGDPNAKFDVKELLQSAASGGLSGLFFGGVGTAVNKAVTLPIRQTAQNVETLPTAAQNGGSSDGGTFTTPSQNGAQNAVTQAPAQQKTVSNKEAVKVNPGARQSVRETVGDMPSAEYQIPHISMPDEALIDASGAKVAESKIPSAIRKYMIRLFRGKVLSIGTDHKVYIDKSGIEEFAFPVRRMDAELKTAKMTAGANLDSTLEPAVFLLNTTDDGHHPEATGGWDNFYVMFKTDTGTYSGVVKTKVTDRGRVFYDITEIQKEGDQSTRGVNGTNPPPARTESPVVDTDPPTGERRAFTVGSEEVPTSDPTIPQQAQGVKTQDMQQGGVVSPESSVGAAAYGFDPYSNLQNQTDDFHPDGERAYRQVDVPKRDANGRNIPKSTATVMEAQATPDSAVGVIQSAIADGKFSFDTNTDKGAVARGEAMILEKGFDGAREVFHQAAQKGYLSKDMVALGQLLLNSAMNSHDNAATVSLMHDYASMSTTAAQSMQAQRILKKLSPEWQLYSVQRSVENFQNALLERLGKKAPDIQVPDELYQNYLAAADQESRDAAMTEIYKNVASQVPASWMDKWNAWRYLSMLGNPRTHIRNIAGNVGFQPLRVTKDAVAAAIEAAASAVTGGKVERTKAFSADPALYRAAWDDWGSVSETLSQGGKYNDAIGEIESRRKIFTLPVLEKARTGNSFLLEAEDAVFKRITYADALAKFLKANGVTAEQLQSGQVEGKLLDRAREYAGQEALKATFQDRNAVSDFVASLGRSQNVPAPVRTIAEGVLPFRRTPANILVRGAEYSPLGLLKSLNPVKIGKFEGDLYKVKNGEMSASQAIDNIAAGATGTALFGLGALLLSMGLVTPGRSDDEKQAALDDLAGKQAYALQLPDGTSYTLDWMAPEALPFFMGVELADNWLKEGFTVDGLAAALSSVSEPMLEMSMLQSVNDLLDSIKYAKSSGNIAGIVQSALTSYLTQAIPTLGGQIERTAEDRRMTTYTDKGLPLPTDVQYAIGKASARLPGLDYQQIPYIDAWGREQEAEPLPIRAAENFLSPGYVSVRKQTEADKEVQRLYSATGDGKVVPTRAAKYVTVNGERKELSKEEYVTYATTKGQTAYQIVEALISNRDYLSMSDTDKADAIANAYEYANAVGKASVSGYHPDGWVKKAIDGQIDPALYILYKASADADGNRSVTQAEAEAAIKRLPVSQKQKAYLWQSQNAGWKAEKNPFQ